MAPTFNRGLVLYDPHFWTFVVCSLFSRLIIIIDRTSFVFCSRFFACEQRLMHYRFMADLRFVGYSRTTVDLSPKWAAERVIVSHHGRRRQFLCLRLRSAKAPYNLFLVVRQLASTIYFGDSLVGRGTGPNSMRVRDRVIGADGFSTNSAMDEPIRFWRSRGQGFKVASRLDVETLGFRVSWSVRNIAVKFAYTCM